MHACRTNARSCGTLVSPEAVHVMVMVMVISLGLYRSPPRYLAVAPAPCGYAAVPEMSVWKNLLSPGGPPFAGFTRLRYGWYYRATSGWRWVYSVSSQALFMYTHQHGHNKLCHSHAGVRKKFFSRLARQQRTPILSRETRPTSNGFLDYPLPKCDRHTCTLSPDRCSE